MTQNDILTMKIAHLAMLQNVISRMASYSLAIKGFCITIVAALIALYIDKANPDFLWFSSISIFFLLFLDAEYLGLEKGFRNYYNLVKESSSPNVIDFSIKPIGDNNFRQALYSWSILSFYLPLLILLAAIIFTGAANISS